MNEERVQTIIIQNRSVIFGYGSIDKTKKNSDTFSATELKKKKLLEIKSRYWDWIQRE